MKRFLSALLLALALPVLPAQTTGPQQLAFSRLSSANHQGQFNSVRVSPTGDLYLLLDQRDGLRLLKLDPTATTVLAQVHLGAQGDIGLALALDPGGNIYATGTSTSGELTGTAGVSFPSPADTSVNSFVVKFDSNLNEQFLTFTGSGRAAAASIAATADAVFVTGSTFSNTLPVTPSAIQQSPMPGSTQNGFVERFSPSGALTYATYLTGFAGNTAPSAIAADSSDNAYIAGYTTSSGYPTLNALVPEIVASASGFLTKLNPDASGILFSTFLPGNGIAALAVDGGSLYLTGNIAIGQFPIASVFAPIANLEYQTLLQLPLDGRSVLASTLLAPGTHSSVAAGSTGVWIAGDLTIPLLPLTPLSDIGDSFALHLDPAGNLDQALRLGALPTANPAYAAIPSALTSLAADPTGNPILAGSLQPAFSNALLATQTFDLPLTPATAALPSTLRDTIPATCTSGVCTASAAWLGKVSTGSDAPALVLSTDPLPNLTLRNLGTAQAVGLELSATGYSLASSCAGTLAAGGDCGIALTGPGPGSITVTASNAASETYSLPASTSTPDPIVFSPHQLDFGIVTSDSPAVNRTVTLTNLGPQSQTFASALDANISHLPYTLAQTSSDCTLSGADKVLAPGGSCHITLGLTASSSSADDGPIAADWLLGIRDLHLTGITQAAALSLSASTIDFGTQYTAGIRLPRFLYLSNHSSNAIAHAAAGLPAGSPFTVADLCPSTLLPHSVCQLRIDYLSTRIPSADSITLQLDNGLTALLTGSSLPQPGANGTAVNPSLSVSPASLLFPNPVAVTASSSDTQTVTLRNTGLTAFSLSLTLTGDFTSTSNCSSSLAANTSCTVVLTFAPSQPGTRNGLLSITAGSGASPAYVDLTGTATAILPANNGILDFGSIPAGSYTTQWYKVAQPFTSLTATTSSSGFTAILVEDLGYGHGAPPTSAFSTSASGPCNNCWLGLQFHSATAGPAAATLALTSPGNGNPYLLDLTANSLPLSGLLLTPLTQDFGPIPIHSTSASALFQLTNLVGPGSLTITPSTTGDFALSTQSTGAGCTAATLAYTASCLLAVDFTPTAAGPRTGTLSITANGNLAAASLTGYGSADPGLALQPASLTFNNVPGPASTQQTITLTNTGPATLALGAPATTGPSFSAAGNCVTLAPHAACTVTVTFVPSTGPVQDTLTLPVTATLAGVSTATVYSIPLAASYTFEDAGLQIIPSEIDFGPGPSSAPSTRRFTINNLTGKSLTLTLNDPRQFAPATSASTCAGLAPNASCTVDLTYLPATAGSITGTLFAQAHAADNTTYSGLAYLQAYGLGQPPLLTLSATQLDFGLTASGQSNQRTLTVTNTGDSGGHDSGPIHLRRVTSEWPFLVTANTCAAALPFQSSCTLTLAYTPLNQVSLSAPLLSHADSGDLVLESDALSSPQFVDLTGAAGAVAVPVPGNTAPIAALSLSQGALTFPNTSAGNASPAQSLTLTNTGTTTLFFSSIAAPTGFTLTNACAAPLVPSASCSVTLAFTPQLTASLDSSPTLEIASTAANALDFVTLNAAAEPSPLTIAPAALDFGSLNLGVSAQLPITLTNSSSVPILLNGLTAGGDYTVSGNCASTLAVHSSCTAQVTFTPTQTGARPGTLSLSTSASTLPLIVPLTGIGTQSKLQITPGALAFGPIALGSSANLPLLLTNTGTAAVTGLALALTGDYALTVPCGVTTLAPGDSCSVTVAFSPTVLGSRPATLTVTSSDPSSPANIPLTGTGVSAGSFTLTANPTSVSVLSGDPAAYTLTVTGQNGFTGSVVLTCAPLSSVQYAACSILPGSVVLSTGAQTSAVTITTLTQQAAPASAHTTPLARTIVLCLLLPVFFFRKRCRRLPTLLAAAFLSALLAAGGCGSGAVPNLNLRYTPAGTYTYQITATTTSGPQVTQTVSLSLTVQ